MDLMMNLVNLPMSANATSAHTGTTERYQFVNTAALVERFMGMGMTIRTAQESKVRREDFRGFQRHLVRLNTPYTITTLTAHGAEVSNIELVLLNQHLGSGRLLFRFGIYRSICLNGLIVGTDLGVAMRIRHAGSSVAALIDQTMQRIELSLPTISERVSMMNARRMSADESRQFASDALTVRGVEVDDLKRRAYSGRELLVVRRPEDRDDTLWNVFNRTQEHLMSGVRGRRGMGLRRITSPTRDVEINERLWTLADEYLNK